MSDLGGLPARFVNFRGAVSKSERKESVPHGDNGTMMEKLRIIGAVAVLATSGFTFVTSTYAQTQGSERRDDRRDTRSEARGAKQECKAGDENSRAECRQEKRDVKQGGGQTQSSQNPAPQNPPSQNPPAGK